MHKRSSLRFLLITSLLISLTIIVVVLSFTVGQKTWEALRQVQFEYIFLSFLLGLLAHCLDSFRIKTLCQAFGFHLPFLDGLKTTLAYNFMANITPSVMGGEPVLIYMLVEKTGIDTKKASAIAVIRGFFLILIIAIAGPVILFFHREYIISSFMKSLFDYLAVLFILIVGITIYAFLHLDNLRAILEKITGLFHRYRIFQKYYDPDVFIRHIYRWMEEFILSFKYLFKQKKISIVYTGGLTVLSMLANYSIAYVLLKGLSYDIHFLKVLSIQIVLYFLLYLTPTPGGSGFAEGGFYLLFYHFVPKHLLGILLILWRFFIAYLWVLVGWVLIIRDLGIKGLEEIKLRFPLE
ncbi:flippase-like domain-containing protein [bacterium]|nr:flippase-like domain-containing protein [bacterium]